MNFLVTLLILVIVLGLLWYIVTLLPLPEPFKNIALVIVCVIVLFYLLAALGGVLPLPALVR